MFHNQPTDRQFFGQTSQPSAIKGHSDHKKTPKGECTTLCSLEIDLSLVDLTLGTPPGSVQGIKFLDETPSKSLADDLALKKDLKK